jgi:hypothetical protein
MPFPKKSHFAMYQCSALNSSVGLINISPETPFFKNVMLWLEWPSDTFYVSYIFSCCMSGEWKNRIGTESSYP